MKFLLLFTLSFTLLAFKSSNIPLYEGQAITSVNKDDLKTITDKIEELNAGYQTKLGKTYLTDRMVLRDEIQNALKKLKLSVTLFSKEYDVSGYAVTPKLKATLQSERNVRLVSEGEINPDNTPGTHRSNFLVSTKVSLYKQASISADLNEDSSANPTLTAFAYETGVTLHKISYANSLPDYLAKSSSDEKTLNNLLGTTDAIDTNLQTEHDSLLQLIGYAESQSKIGKIAQKLTISDQLKIFLEGILKDPKNVAKTFYKISAKDLMDDKLLKKGETLIKSYYIKRTIPGFGLRKDAGEVIASLGIRRNLYTILRVGFQKGNDGKIYIKTQFEEYPEWNGDASLSLFVSALKIFRLNYKNSKIDVKEKLFEVDLSSAAAQIQVNELFDRLGNPIHTQDEYNTILASFGAEGSSVKKHWDRIRSSLGNVEKFTTRLEVGLLGYTDDDIKRVEEVVTENAEGALTEITGIVQQASKFSLRIWKLLKSKEEEVKRFRIFARKTPGRAAETDLGFEYFTTDSKTSDQEYYDYIKLVKTAFFLANHVKGTSAQEVKNFLDARLASKISKKDEQAVTAGIYFGQGFIQKILAKDPNYIKVILANMILGPVKHGNGAELVDGIPRRWKDLLNIRNNAEHISLDGKDCSKAVRGEYASLLLSSNISTLLQCNRIKAVALGIEKAFLNAQAAQQNSGKMVQVFTELVDNKDVAPLLPLLMLQVGLANGYDEKGNVQFNGIQEAIDNNELELNASLLGTDIDGIQTVQVGDVLTLKPTMYENDFDLADPLDQASVVYTAQAYQSNGDDLYVRITSVLNMTDADYDVVGGLYKDNQLIGLLKVNQILLSSQEKDPSAKEYDYLLKFPIVDELTKGEKYAMKLYVVDRKTQTYVTEPVEIRFRLRN